MQRGRHGRNPRGGGVTQRGPRGCRTCRSVWVLDARMPVRVSFSQFAAGGFRGIGVLCNTTDSIPRTKIPDCGANACQSPPPHVPPPSGRHHPGLGAGAPLPHSCAVSSTDIFRTRICKSDFLLCRPSGGVGRAQAWLLRNVGQSGRPRGSTWGGVSAYTHESHSPTRTCLASAGWCPANGRASVLLCPCDALCGQQLTSRL